ncbi:hypothetical protein AB0F72_38050 [Actinoplanes sp. NPDC023936]|uniref:hypothetical protein n=1 Tax=Actinoplanes sp. NPDC023936 TaxID=3154910 RepID=UPI003410FFA3
MTRTGKVLMFAVPVAAATAATVAAKSRAKRTDHQRRHVITIYRPLSELESEQLPGSLREITGDVEITLRPAPGDRGTEIAVRIPEGSKITEGQVRAALRETRSLLETGDVLLPSGPATTVKTLTNRPLQTATRHGREGGLL